MPPFIEKPGKILLIEPSVSRAKELSRSISSQSQLILLPHCRTLEEAYNLTELHEPNLVFLSDALVTTPGFAMYKALLDGLKADWVFISSRKPAANLEKYMHRLFDFRDVIDPEKVMSFVSSRLRDKRKPLKPVIPNVRKDISGHLVVIGASTGGVEALTEVLGGYPRDCPPTLIVQHMGHRFIEGFVRRLDANCDARVAEAQEGLPIVPGQVLVAPGLPKHLTISPNAMKCALSDDAPMTGHRPSVDALFLSAVQFGPKAVGVLLTGMGRDGAEGLRRIRAGGGRTIAQDKETSIVFGMPKTACDFGAVETQLPLKEIGPAILRACAKLEKGRIA